MSEIRTIRPADDDHQVVEVHSAGAAYRRQPCSDCPWRQDATGVFPAEAFRISADTGHDMSTRKFGCHQSGTRKPATCAGFLLQGADHNLTVRLRRMQGEMCDVDDGGHALFDDYFDMAVANGVDPDDPALANVRRRRR